MRLLEKAFLLVPKLCLGTRCLEALLRQTHHTPLGEAELRGSAFPSGSLGTRLLTMLLFLLLALPGCGRDGGPKPEPQEDGKKRAPAKGFARTLQRENAKGELKNLGLYYLQYLDTNRGKPPPSVEHFIEFFKRDHNALYNAVRDGYYKVNLKAPLGGAAIIAYEAEADEQGNVLAVRGNGEVGTMSMSDVRRELEQP